MATWDDVRELALTLPDTAEVIRFGRPAWKVPASARNSTAFVWERPFSKADIAREPEVVEGEILGARVDDEDEKRALIAAEPQYFFTIQHFDGFPAVLVKLDLIPRDRLAEVMSDAWIAVAPKKLVADYLAEPS